jgi:hypothetical protein
MLKLEVVQQFKTGTTPCAICLLPCELSPTMIAVRGGESDYIVLADLPFLCLRCAYGGVDRIVGELRTRAERSRDVAAQLDRWADEGIAVPSDLQAVLGSRESLGWLFGPKPRTI